MRVERQTASRHGLDYMERTTIEVTPTMTVDALLELVRRGMACTTLACKRLHAKQAGQDACLASHRRRSPSGS